MHQLSTASADEMHLLDGNQCGVRPGFVVSHSNLQTGSFSGVSFKFLPYQLWKVVYWTTLALTGNGELGFDSGEGA